MTTQEAIEYITSTTREYRDREKANDAEGCAGSIMRCSAWSVKNSGVLMEAAYPHDKPAVIAALWADTVGSFAMIFETMGPNNMPADRLMGACFAFAKEAEKYAET